jgi:hypothetical protein
MQAPEARGRLKHGKLTSTPVKKLFYIPTIILGTITIKMSEK